MFPFILDAIGKQSVQGESTIPIGNLTLDAYGAGANLGDLTITLDSGNILNANNYPTGPSEYDPLFDFEPNMILIGDTNGTTIVR